MTQTGLPWRRYRHAQIAWEATVRERRDAERRARDDEARAERLATQADLLGYTGAHVVQMTDAEREELALRAGVLAPTDRLWGRAVDLIVARQARIQAEAERALYPYPED